MSDYGIVFHDDGCQSTPEESAVVSKAKGLREDTIAEPLEDAEKVTLDVPSPWEMEEKRSKDRVTISAELELGTMEVGNLPVIEKSNYELSQQELEALVSYFSKDKELYVPNVNTKEVYQYVMDRIENQEGSYSNTFMASSYSELKSAVKKAEELAPETDTESEIVEVKFQKILEDSAKIASEDWSGGKSWQPYMISIKRVWNKAIVSVRRMEKWYNELAVYFEALGA